MEKTLQRLETDMQQVRVSTERTNISDWRHGLPVLKGDQVALRELRPSDAASLASLLTTEEVSRFIWQPPATTDAFEGFIARSVRQRAAGTGACFAITLRGFDTAIGLFQVRETAPNFGSAEWGFAIGSPFWGMGIFEEAAKLVLEFAFETLHVHRLEARVAVRNGRGQGALRKLGAVQEGVLRKSLLRDGEYLDQALFTMIAEEWRASRKAAPTTYALVH
jgi:RimJ/RimL family protein N-acetyltransferase